MCADARCCSCCCGLWWLRDWCSCCTDGGGNPMCLHECGSTRRKGPGKESEGRGREPVTVSVSCALKENVLQILGEEYDWLTSGKIKWVSHCDYGSSTSSKHLCIRNRSAPHGMDKTDFFPFYLLFLFILWNYVQTHLMSCFRSHRQHLTICLLTGRGFVSWFMS